MLIKDWLEELGYEALGPAHCASQALAAIEGDNPDAALLDVSLGDADSYRVVDALETRNIPFAFGMELEFARALSAELARATFKAAMSEHPERRINLRKGTHVNADSTG